MACVSSVLICLYHAGVFCLQGIYEFAWSRQGNHCLVGTGIGQVAVLNFPNWEEEVTSVQVSCYSCLLRQLFGMPPVLRSVPSNPLSSSIWVFIPLRR